MILPKMSKIVHFIAFFIATKHYQTSFETKKERRQYPFPKIPVFHLYECANVLTALKCQLFHKFFCPCQRLRLADINQFQLLRKITGIIRLPASSQIKIHDGKLAFPARCLHQPEDSRRKDMNTAKGILSIQLLII